MNLVQWHWKVFWNIEYWFDLDIPNLQNVKLPHSFKYLLYPITKSNINLFYLNLDVSELLFPKINSVDFIQALSTSITTIILPNWTCCDTDYITFDFSRFTLVESIEIGDDCFRSVKTFKIDGLNRLKSLKIGKNSFTQKKNLPGSDELKSFHILNCESLESIKIEEYSFSDFGGQFELKNLPKLQTIIIGSVLSLSYNFYHSSFVVRGNIIIMIIEWLDLPNLQSIILGFATFAESLSTVIESIEQWGMKWLNRSSFINSYYSGWSLSIWNWYRWVVFINHAK